MFVVALAAVALVVALFGVVDHQRKVDRMWGEVSRQLGLAFQGHERLHGQYEGRAVSVDTVVRGSGKNKAKFMRVLVSAPAAASGLTITAEGAWSKLKKLVGADDVRVMDETFDRAVQVQGDSVQAVALLDEDTRLLMRQLLEAQGCWLEAGVFYRETRGVDVDAAGVIWTVRAATRVANRMDVDPYALEEKLAENATHDGNPSVRLRNFELLQGRYHGHAVTRRVAEAALADDDLGMRIVAAREVADDRAFDVLKQVAEGPGNADHRWNALDAMLDLYSYERVAPTLDMVLRTGRPELRALAVKAIGTAADPTRREAVERCVGKGDDGLDLAAATALSRLGDPSSEDVLVRLLSSDSEPVRRAAVEALGGLATVRAVESLLPLTQGFSLGGGLKELARDAIRQIQSRIGPAEGGRLSVVSLAAEEGALSFAGEGGGLSIADETEKSAPSQSKVRG